MASFLKGKLSRNKKSTPQRRKNSGPQSISSDGLEKKTAGDLSGAVGREDAVSPAQEIGSPQLQVVPGEDEVTGVSGGDGMDHGPLTGGPTVQMNSIFSGLQLSTDVAKAEAPDSPYLHRAQGNSSAEDNGNVLY